MLARLVHSIINSCNDADVTFAVIFNYFRLFTKLFDELCFSCIFFSIVESIVTANWTSLSGSHVWIVCFWLVARIQCKLTSYWINFTIFNQFCLIFLDLELYCHLHNNFNKSGEWISRSYPNMNQKFMLFWVD